MALIVISIDRDKLPNHTEDELLEWVRYEIGETSGVHISNPLSNEDLQAEVREY